MSVRSTQHHTLLHNPTIIHMKNCLRQLETRTRYTAVCQNDPHDMIRFYIILQFYIRRHFLRQPITRAIKYFQLQNKFQHTHLSWNVSFFLYVGIGIGLGLRYNQALTRNQYKSLHTTTLVFFLHSLTVLSHSQRQGSVRQSTFFASIKQQLRWISVGYSYSGFPKWDSFDRI